MKFELLDGKVHGRAEFDCGVEGLNTYLARFANQDVKRGLATVYVLADGRTIVGYYSLSAHSVLRDNLPDGARLGSYEEIPFLLLGRLAVDKRFQSKGFGDALIAHAFRTTRTAASQVGIFGMLVEAKDEAAARFYEGFGFARLSGTKNKLVLPLSAMDAAWGA